MNLKYLFCYFISIFVAWIFLEFIVGYIIETVDDIHGKKLWKCSFLLLISKTSGHPVQFPTREHVCEHIFRELV